MGTVGVMVLSYALHSIIFDRFSAAMHIGYRRRRRRIFISPIAKTLLQHDHNI